MTPGSGPEPDHRLNDETTRKTRVSGFGAPIRALPYSGSAGLALAGFDVAGAGLGAGVADLGRGLPLGFGVQLGAEQDGQAGRAPAVMFTPPDTRKSLSYYDINR